MATFGLSISDTMILNIFFTLPLEGSCVSVCRFVGITILGLHRLAIEKGN